MIHLTARRVIFCLIYFGVGIAMFGYGNNAAAEDEAPRDGMQSGFWASGVKEMVGSAYEAYDSADAFSAQSPTAPISKVWFTGAQGVLTEVFWPEIDEAQVRDSQFLVTDGSSFVFEERKNSTSTVSWIEKGVPMYRAVNQDPAGRFEIERTFFTDPDRDVVLQKVKITRHVAGLKFYLLHKPMVSNTPFGDSALATTGDVGPGAGLFAWQQQEAQAVVTSVGLKETSAAFAGTPQDGWNEIGQSYQMKSHYHWAHDGNVVLTAHLDIPETVGSTDFGIALGFATKIEDAYALASQSLNQIDDAANKFTQQWQGYQATIKDLSTAANDGGALFRASVAVLKSMEDKNNPGAFVAGPSVPWGIERPDSNDGYFPQTDKTKLTSGYHIVWPRDLYQMATAFLAIGDASTARASLNYLRHIQYGPEAGNWNFSGRVHTKDGSFPQNFWVDGTNHWGGLQLDEVSMPVVLIHRMWKSGDINVADYWDMARRAADFLKDYGPWTPEERWEEVGGLSPSTTAAEIAALNAASDIAAAMNDSSRSLQYAATAKTWNDSVEKWMMTTSGAKGDGKYFVRIVGAGTGTANWDPNSNDTFTMANGAGTWREKDVLDGGFLELVRFGVRSATSDSIVETIKNYDLTIRVDYAGIGPSFRRYLGDKYGYDEGTGAQTLGMPWPILTGERGHYELAKAVAMHAGVPAVDFTVAPYVSAMEGFATESHMLPEQVWDQTGNVGKPTGAATPLGWAHGEYLKLLRSRFDGRVFDLE